MEREFGIGPFQELIDLEEIEKLQKDFSAVTGLATQLLDVDGYVLTRSNWSDVCTDFHLRSPVGIRRCRNSAEELLAAVERKRAGILKVCQNGLVTAATPVFIDDYHLATLIVGQLFLEPPDENYFRDRARELGVDVEAYLAALRRVPVLSEKNLWHGLRFLADAVTLILHLGQHSWEQSILEQRLERERARLDAVFQGTGDGMRIIGTDYRIVDQNAEMERLSGVSAAEAVGRKCFQSFHHDRCGTDRCVLHRILAGEERVILEVEKRWPDGRKIEVDLIATPLRAVSGGIVGVIESYRDVTRRNQAERELRASRENLRTIFNSVYDAIFIHELDGKIIDVNAKMLELYGVDRRQACNLSIIEDYSGPESPVEQLPEIWKKVAAGEEQLFEWQARRPGEGSCFDAQVYLRKLTLDGRDVILATVRDITESKQNRLALQRANEELETANEELVAVNEELIAAEEELRTQLQQLEESREELESANRRLMDIIEFLPDPTFVVNREKKVIAWNRAIEELTGVRKEEMLGRGDYAYAVPFYGERRPILVDLINADLPSFRQYYEQVRKDGDTLYAEVFVPLLDKGRGAHLWAKASPLYDRQGNVVGGIESVRDMSEHRRAREELKRQKSYFEQLFENSPEGIVMLDNEDRIVLANKGFQKLFGYTRDEVVGRGINEVIVPADYLEEAVFLSRRALGGEVVQQESVRRRKDGSLLHVSILGYPIVVDGRQVGIYGIYSDISERKQGEEKLKYLSLHDTLTGLYNRHYFEQEMRRVEGLRQAPVALIVCDVDGLKLVNDTLGHDLGDALLRDVAAVIRSCFRAGDMVARVGGDEFAVLLPGSDREMVEKAAGRLREAITGYNAENPGMPLSISVGFAVSEEAPVNASDLFREADNNMYREKLHRSRSTRSAIVHTLMKALEARDFITEGHGERLQELVVRMATALNLSERSVIDLRLLAKFHDIGKVGIPDRILFKGGILTPEERTEMQRHCEIGHRIALSAPDLVPIADWILKHHEWWNGEGYPLGIRGEEIPLECRILAIADAYDAMTSDRPYRKAMSHREAVAELRRCAGTQFDPELVEVFINLVDETKNARNG